MISHVSLGVSNLARSIAFYDAVLDPLGQVRVWSHPHGVGYGLPGGPDKLALFHRPECPGKVAAGDRNRTDRAAPLSGPLQF